MSPTTSSEKTQTGIWSALTAEDSFLRVPRDAAILVTVWVVSVLAALSASHFGRYAIATMSGDWAQQMYLVETDYHNAGLPANSPDRLADEGLAGGFGSNYPHLSHAITAYTAYFLDLNPLRSMQVWAIIALLSGCYAMAIRLVLIGGMPSSSGVFFCALWLVACSYTGFGLRGHIEGNFFFAQFFGTALAVAGFAVLQRIHSTGWPVLGGIVLWGGVVLPNTHLVPAVWFTFAALIHLFLREENIRSASIKCGAVTLACGLLAINGATGAMLQVASNNGWFLTRFGQLTDHATAALAIGLAVVFTVLAGLLARVLLIRRWEVLRRTLLPFAGLIAISILVGVQAFSFLVLHRGSVYAVAKLSYLLALEMSVVVISVKTPLTDSTERLLQRHLGWTRPGCVILLFLAQMPFIATPDDQALLMKVRERLLDLGITYNPQHRLYPQFSAFDYDRNFYLAIAVMRIPRDDRTFKWLLSGAQGEESLTWPTANPFGRPPLGEDPAMLPGPASSYQYTVHLTPAEGRQTAPMIYRMRRPSILKIDIDAPQQGRFKLATSIPAAKGCVALGYYAFDKSSKQIEQGRSLFTRNGNRWHAEIPLSNMPPSLGSIEFSPVQEWMTWFYWQQQPNIKRIEFAE